MESSINLPRHDCLPKPTSTRELFIEVAESPVAIIEVLKGEHDKLVMESTFCFLFFSFFLCLNLFLWKPGENPRKYVPWSNKTKNKLFDIQVTGPTGYGKK